MAVERKWEVHPLHDSQTAHLVEIAAAIQAAVTLKLPYVTLTAERADHFMQGGNVNKGTCVKFTLRCDSKLPSPKA